MSKPLIGGEPAQPSSSKAAMELNFHHPHGAAAPKGGTRENPQVIDLTKWEILGEPAESEKPKPAPEPQSNPASKVGGARVTSTAKPGYKFVGGRPIQSAQANPSERVGSESKTAAMPSPDFRRNVDRQVREQKAISSVLGSVGLAAFALIILFGGLACYGAYVIFGEIKAQKVTTAQLRDEMQGGMESNKEQIEDLRTALALEQENAVKLGGELQKKHEAVQNLIAEDKKVRDAELRQLRTEMRIIRDRVSELEVPPTGTSPRSR